MFNTPSPSEHSEDTSGDGSFFACTSSHVAVPSPVIDAVDAFPSLERSELRKSGEEPPRSTAGVIKIGQTSLHNPGGRSSWIGL